MISLNNTERRAVFMFSSKHGEHWKRKLRHGWIIGTGSTVLDGMRDTHGREWLAGFEYETSGAADECAWCGGEPQEPERCSNRAGEVFCCELHRDASTRALRRFVDSMESQAQSERAS